MLLKYIKVHFDVHLAGRVYCQTN